VLTRIRTMAPLFAIALVATACSGDATTEDTSESTSAPTTATTEASPTTTVAQDTTTTTEAPPPPQPEFLWADVTDVALPGDTTDTWSNKVELADIDADGDVDILFADGGDQTRAGDPQINQAWLNDGTGVFTDASEAVFGSTGDLARVIKARDVNGDDIVDLVVGTTWVTQTRLYLGTGEGAFEEVTETHLPAIPLSTGDLEVGDVDGDGDLDMVLADWGEGHPSLSGGGVTRLWLNDGSGVFTDATDRMPQVPVEWSWELELVDIDNDFDLDIAISCKACTGSFLFENDGTGTFTDVSDRLPQFANSYEFEAIDLSGDGFLDLVTLNDGDPAETALGNHVFFADGDGGFHDVTAQAHPGGLGTDDNMTVFLDFDSDGDADVLVAHLGTRDRLMVNDGTGAFSLLMEIFSGDGTGGALGMAAADLNADGRIDIVQSQGEIGDMTDKVFLGALVEPDTAPPIIGPATVIEGVLHVRLHDNKSPLMPHDFTTVTVTGPSGEMALEWYGEYLWRGAAGDVGDYTICATDAAGNQACSDPISVG